MTRLLLTTWAAALLAAAGAEASSNVALGRPVTLEGVGENNLVAAVTDGKLAPEGARPDDSACGLQGVRSALVIDLGSAHPLRALLVQADVSDVYFVETSTDGQAWDVAWRVPPLAGVGSLRTRRIVWPEARTARFVRIRPTTGQAPSVSELQAFDGVPDSWPPLDLSHRGARLPMWPSLSGARLGLLAMAVAALLLAVVVWSALARRYTETPGELRLRRGVLVATAVAALVAWFNFFNFHYTGFVHTWEVFHYYMGGKYLPELGYARLYLCAAAADLEEGIDLRGHAMRDLRTNQMVAAESELARASECARRFSPRRWDEFRRDARFFREAMAVGWLAVRGDHGFNATPAWAVAGRLLAGSGPASWSQIGFLAVIDLVLLAAVFGILARVFGWEAACLAAGFWGTNTLGLFVWTGGGFLRYDWVLALAIGVAALKLERQTLAGAALGYAAMSRVFPAVVIAGVLAKAVGEAVAERSVAPLRRLARFAMGALAAVLLLGLVSSIVAGRASIWSEFADNTAKHAASISSNLVGLRVWLAYDDDHRLQLTTDPLRQDRHEDWRAQVSARQARVWWVRWLAAFAFLGLLARAARGRPDWVAAVLGLGLMPIALDLSSYYYAGFLLFASLWVVRPAFGVALAGLACVSNVVMGLWSFPDEQQARLSLLVVVFVVAVTAALAGRRR